jgi:hypothetical protein
MSKLLSISLVIVLLGLPLGIASAQDGDPCQEAGGMIDDQTGKCMLRANVDIQISYPVEIATLSAAKFAVDDYLAKLQDDFMDNFIASAPEFTGFAPWSLYVDYTLYYRPGFSVGVVFTVSEYTGGAHPSSYYKTFLFGESDGFELHLASLFEPGSNPYATLAQVVPAKLLEQYPGMYDPTFAPLTEDPLSYQKFTLTADSIIFFFDQYEVAPGAAGTLQATVPLAELGGILVPALRS